MNKQLSNKLKTKNITYVCNKNISLHHLNKGGLHFNKRGDGALALNLINHIRSWDEKVFVSVNRKNPNIKTYIGTKPAKGACDNVCSMSAETISANKSGSRMMALNIFSLMPHLDEL